MTASVSLHKRKTLFLVVLFIAFSAFTADILDLREELCILSSPSSSLESNISDGIISHTSILPEPTLILHFTQKKRSVKISFLHLMSYGFRAPPPDHSWLLLVRILRITPNRFIARQMSPTANRSHRVIRLWASAENHRVYILKNTCLDVWYSVKKAFDHFNIHINSICWGR